MQLFYKKNLLSFLLGHVFFFSGNMVKVDMNFSTE
jgi:hypothetical protein